MVPDDVIEQLRQAAALAKVPLPRGLRSGLRRELTLRSAAATSVEDLPSEFNVEEPNSGVYAAQVPRLHHGRCRVGEVYWSDNNGCMWMARGWSHGLNDGWSVRQARW